MIKVGSISGGQTSAYMEVHHPSDFPIFSLVRIDSRKCLWMEGKDEKTRQLISDRIGCEFIGTAEMDDIIYTILDLEQFLGREIKIVTGTSFEQTILDAHFIPNRIKRICTIKMKLEPIFNFLNEENVLPVEMNIGYRFNELSRIETIKSRMDENGFE